MSLAANPGVRRAAFATVGVAVSIVSLFLVARSVNLADAARIVANASAVTALQQLTSQLPSPTLSWVRPEPFVSVGSV